MRFLSPDTRPEAAAVQLDLLRQASVGRRAAMARGLSATMIELSRRALRANMPSATEGEVMDRWVALNYGEQLARRLRAYLATQAR